MKIYADATLENMTKKQLIGIIRCLEHNNKVLQEQNDNQYKLLSGNELFNGVARVRLFSEIVAKSDEIYIYKKGVEDAVKVANGEVSWLNADKVRKEIAGEHGKRICNEFMEDMRSLGVL